MSSLRSFGKCVLAAGVLSGLLASNFALGAQIHKCMPAKNECSVRLPDGIVGDNVKVLDEKARVVATGYIVQKKGSFGLIRLVEPVSEVKRGYPVLVDLERRSSDLNWAASFGN